MGEPGERTVQGRIRIPPGRATVDVPGDLPEVVRLAVPARRGERPQPPGGAGYPAEAGAGGGEDEPAYPVRRLVCELLGEQAAERDTEQVDFGVPEHVEQFLHGPGEAAHAPWRRVATGAAHPRRVDR